MRAVYIGTIPNRIPLEHSLVLAQSAEHGCDIEEGADPANTRVVTVIEMGGRLRRFIIDPTDHYEEATVALSKWVDDRKAEHDEVGIGTFTVGDKEYELHRFNNGAMDVHWLSVNNPLYSKAECTAGYQHESKYKQSPLL